MNTLIINHELVSELVEIELLKNELIRGFICYSNGTSRRDGQRIVLDVSQENKATVLGPGTAAGIPAYTIKTNSKFPGSHPAIKGVIALFDQTNGQLMALLDSASITAIRTGLCAALATDCLAPRTARVMGIIGAGNQNRLLLDYLLTLRDLRKVNVFDTNSVRAKEFTETFASKVECRAFSSIAKCLEDATVISTATWSRQSIIDLTDLHQATHITTLGADERGKVELSANLVRQSKLFCDDADLNMIMGTPGSLGLSRKDIFAEIGEVFASPEKGRLTDRELTVYSSVGLPFQDLVTAWHVFKKASEYGNVPEISMSG